LTLEELINTFDVKVQNYEHDKRTFREFIEPLLKDYYVQIRNIDLLEGINPAIFPYINSSKNKLLGKVQILVEGLLDVINHLIEGSLDGMAYAKFVKMKEYQKH
jgi:hypothetical protein